MLALRDNPTAIAEGASGAPRIEESAMAANSIAIDKASVVSAGNSVRFRQDAMRQTGSTSFVTEIDEYIANNGTSVRVSLSHRVATGAINNRQSEVRVLRNDSVLVTWQTTSQTLVDRTIDVTFNRNDRIRIQHRETSGEAGDSIVGNMRFSTTGRSLWPGRAGYV